MVTISFEEQRIRHLSTASATVRMKCRVMTKVCNDYVYCVKLRVGAITMKFLSDKRPLFVLAASWRFDCVYCQGDYVASEEDGVRPCSIFFFFSWF